jgi:hypothetical protein
MGWMTWWLWRGACTRSHPELGRENPQRPWYCVSRRGRVGRRQVFQPIRFTIGAGWSSPVARQAHNLKAAGSNPAPATTLILHCQDAGVTDGGIARGKPQQSAVADELHRKARTRRCSLAAAGTRRPGGPAALAQADDFTRECLCLVADTSDRQVGWTATTTRMRTSDRRSGCLKSLSSRCTRRWR